MLVYAVLTLVEFFQDAAIMLSIEKEYLGDDMPSHLSAIQSFVSNYIVFCQWQ